MAGETELVLSGDGLPPTAVRGIRETLEPIANPQFRKYRWRIECSDINSPAFDAVWPGDWRRTINGGFVDLSGMGTVLTVQCVSDLAYLAASQSPAGESPLKSEVPGLTETVGDFTFYRPELTIGITAKSQQTDEVGAVVSWTLEGEEI